MGKETYSQFFIMIVPSKIVVRSIKLDKRLSGVQWLPVLNTLGIDLLVYLEQASEQIYKGTFWCQTDQEVKTP